MTYDTTIPNPPQPEKVLTCDYCGEPINDPLNRGAIVWQLVARENTIFNTAFRITHRLPGCIHYEQKRPQWRYLSDFFHDGEVDFGVLLNPRYDDFGYRIDYDAEYDKESIENVYFRLVAVLETSEPVTRQEQPKKKPSKPVARAGYVYLIQSPTGHYKIGRTVNPADRMKTFTVKLPFEVEFVCVIATEDMYTLERGLHRQFKQKRINGEWFQLSPEDVEYIKGLTS